MPSIDIAPGQSVRIPALQLSNGRPFAGVVRAGDGETMLIDVAPEVPGTLPATLAGQAVLVWEADGIQRACPIQAQPRAERTLLVRVALQERRESPRVPVDLDVIYEVIEPERVKETADEVLARVNTLEESAPQAARLLQAAEDPLTALREEVGVLHAMLAALLTKVDDLQAMLAGLQPTGAGRRLKHPLAVLNCSGTGLGLLVSEPHAEGEYLRLRLTLRTMPPSAIDCMGVVVRARAIEQAPAGSPPVPRYDVGVRFTHIHETDRERLIQYLFKVQRRLLRDRREARAALAG